MIALYLLAGAISLQSAQAQNHPFAPSQFVTGLNMGRTAALLDVNKDGSRDVITSGFLVPTVSSLDEDGGEVAAFAGMVGVAPSVPGPGFPLIFAQAGGHLDNDDKEDYVAFSSAGTVHFYKNLGSTNFKRVNFAAAQEIDNSIATDPNYQVSPPFINFSVPYIKVLDFDGDTHNDILLLGSNVNTWSGQTLRTFVRFYQGDGNGNFTTYANASPGLDGNVIDAVVADLNNNGTADTLVVLLERGSALAGAYGYEVVHLGFNGNALVDLVGFPQPIGLGRVTAIQMANVSGDNNKDYIYSTLIGTGGLGYNSAVYYQEGDGQGNLQAANGMLTLPPNTGVLNDYILSIKVADFNNDQIDDIAILRNYAYPQGSAWSPSQPIVDNTEVLVSMGSGPLSFASTPVEAIAFDAYLNERVSFYHNFFLRPHRSHAPLLEVVDLAGGEGDGVKDLLVTNMIQSTGGNFQMGMGTIKNQTTPATGKSYVAKVGYPSGGNPMVGARLGIEGSPTLGNTISANLAHLRGGVPYTLAWSFVGQENIIPPWNGVDMHLVPAEIGYWGITSGNQETDGFASYPIQVPNQPSLIGSENYFMGVYWDHVQQKWGGTQASKVVPGTF